MFCLCWQGFSHQLKNCTTILLILCTILFAASTSLSSGGVHTRFIAIPFLKPNESSDVSVVIESHSNTTNCISSDTLRVGDRTITPSQGACSGNKFQHNFTLQPGEITSAGNIGGAAIHLSVILNGSPFQYSVRLQYQDLAPFSVYALDTPGTQYNVVTYCQILGFCYVAVTRGTINDGTSNVSVKLPNDRSIKIKLNENYYQNGQEFTFQLKNSQIAVFECKACDLTGTTINSSSNLVVFAGGRETVVRTGNSTTSFISQIFPVNTWGRSFFLFGSEASNVGDIFRVISRYDDTVVKMDKFHTSRLRSTTQWIQKALYPGDVVHISADKPIMIAQIITKASGQSKMTIVPPIEQYYDTEFSVKCQFEGLSIYSTDNPGPIYKPIGLSGYVYVPFNATECSLGKANGIIVVVNRIDASIIDMQYISNPVLKEIFVTKPMVAGDMEDNDNDGQIDEDTCGYKQFFSGFELHVAQKLNFNEAKEQCAKSNSELCVANTPEKFRIFKEYVRAKREDITDQYVWVGIYKNTQFTWSDGSAIQQLSEWWDSDQPNDKNCGLLRVSNFRLHDDDCMNNRPFVCANWTQNNIQLDCNSNIHEEEDTKGVSFVFPACLLRDYTSYKIEVISGKTDDAISRVEKYNNEPGSQTITYVSQRETVNATYRFTSQNDSRNVYRITSYTEVSVYVTMENDDHMVSTILFPTDVLGLEYFAATYCGDNCKSYCIVTSIHNDTIVDIIFPNTNLNVSVTGVDFNDSIVQKMSVRYELNQYTSIKLETEQDLTGTYIKADNPISMICGTQFNKYAMAEQIIPTKFYQTEKFTKFELSKENREIVNRIMASNMFTSCETVIKIDNVNIKSLLFFKRHGDFEELNSDSYDELVSIKCNKPVLVWIIVMDQNAGHMVLTHSAVTDYNWPYGYKAQAKAWSTTSNVQFKQAAVCAIGGPTDPDCDGLTEEDICVLTGHNFLPEKHLLQPGKFIPDFDLDGNYDEDCFYTSPECYMPNITHGHAEDEAPETHVTSVLHFTCDENYTAYQFDRMTCYANGSWYPEPLCLPDCPDPSTIFLSPLAVDDDANNLAVGENVTLKCVRGYTLFGDPSVTCFQNSTWAEEECWCLEDCSDPQKEYNNSIIAINGSWSVGSNVTMQCTNDLFVIGDPVLVCDDNSKWTNNSFTCSPGCTKATNLVSNAKMKDPDRLRPMNSTHEMICNDGYSVKGNAFITCLDNTTWSEPEFSCVTSCNDPRLTSSDFMFIPNFNEGTPFLEGITVSLKCRPGSTMVGSSRITCLANKKWTDRTRCIRDCPDPRNHFDIPYAYLKRFDSKSSLAYGTTYDFRCNLFYTMYGDGKIRCQQDSTWSSVNITCKTCNCPRRKRGNPRYDNMTSEDETKIKEETRGELQVEKSAVSAAVRKKKSATDKRPSAQNVGYIGAILLGVIGGGIILVDFARCFRYFKCSRSD